MHVRKQIRLEEEEEQKEQNEVHEEAVEVAVSHYHLQHEEVRVVEGVVPGDHFQVKGLEGVVEVVQKVQWIGLSKLEEGVAAVEHELLFLHLQEEGVVVEVVAVEEALPH